MIKLMYTLMYQNQIVGYRLLYEGLKYDVAREDVEAFREDFPDAPLQDQLNMGRDIDLQDNDGQLVESGADSIPEWSYGFMAATQGAWGLYQTDGALKLLYNRVRGALLPALVAVEWDTGQKVPSGNQIMVDGQSGAYILRVHMGVSSVTLPMVMQEGVRLLQARIETDQKESQS